MSNPKDNEKIRVRDPDAEGCLKVALPSKVNKMQEPTKNNTKNETISGLGGKGCGEDAIKETTKDMSDKINKRDKPGKKPSKPLNNRRSVSEQRPDSSIKTSILQKVHDSNIQATTEFIANEREKQLEFAKQIQKIAFNMIDQKENENQSENNMIPPTLLTEDGKKLIVKGVDDVSLKAPKDKAKKDIKNRSISEPRKKATNPNRVTNNNKSKENKTNLQSVVKSPTVRPSSDNKIKKTESVVKSENIESKISNQQEVKVKASSKNNLQEDKIQKPTDTNKKHEVSDKSKEGISTVPAVTKPNIDSGSIQNSELNNAVTTVAVLNTIADGPYNKNMDSNENEEDQATPAPETEKEKQLKTNNDEIVIESNAVVLNEGSDEIGVGVLPVDVNRDLTKKNLFPESDMDYSGNLLEKPAERKEKKTVRYRASSPGKDKTKAESKTTEYHDFETQTVNANRISPKAKEREKILQEMIGQKTNETKIHGSKMVDPKTTDPQTQSRALDEFESDVSINLQPMSIRVIGSPRVAECSRKRKCRRKKDGDVVPSQSKSTHCCVATDPSENIACKRRSKSEDRCRRKSRASKCTPRCEEGDCPGGPKKDRFYCTTDRPTDYYSGMFGRISSAVGGQLQYIACTMGRFRQPTGAGFYRMDHSTTGWINMDNDIMSCSSSSTITEHDNKKKKSKRSANDRHSDGDDTSEQMETISRDDSKAVLKKQSSTKKSKKGSDDKGKASGATSKGTVRDSEVVVSRRSTGASELFQTTDHQVEQIDVAGAETDVAEQSWHEFDYVADKKDSIQLSRKTTNTSGTKTVSGQRSTVREMSSIPSQHSEGRSSLQKQERHSENIGDDNLPESRHSSRNQRTSTYRDGLESERKSTIAQENIAPPVEEDDKTNKLSTSESSNDAKMTHKASTKSADDSVRTTTQETTKKLSSDKAPTPRLSRQSKQGSSVQNKRSSIEAVIENEQGAETHDESVEASSQNIEHNSLPKESRQNSKQSKLSSRPSLQRPFEEEQDIGQEDNEYERVESYYSKQSSRKSCGHVEEEFVEEESIVEVETGPSQKASKRESHFDQQAPDLKYNQGYHSEGSAESEPLPLPRGSSKKSSQSTRESKHDEQYIEQEIGPFHEPIASSTRSSKKSRGSERGVQEHGEGVPSSRGSKHSRYSENRDSRHSEYDAPSCQRESQWKENPEEEQSTKYRCSKCSDYDMHSCQRESKRTLEGPEQVTSARCTRSSKCSDCDALSCQRESKRTSEGQEKVMPSRSNRSSKCSDGGALSCQRESRRTLEGQDQVISARGTRSSKCSDCGALSCQRESRWTSEGQEQVISARGTRSSKCSDCDALLCQRESKRNLDISEQALSDRGTRSIKVSDSQAISSQRESRRTLETQVQSARSSRSNKGVEYETQQSRQESREHSESSGQVSSARESNHAPPHRSIRRSVEVVEGVQTPRGSKYRRRSDEVETSPFERGSKRSSDGWKRAHSPVESFASEAFDFESRKQSKASRTSAEDFERDTLLRQSDIKPSKMVSERLISCTRASEEQESEMDEDEMIEINGLGDQRKSSNGQSLKSSRDGKIKSVETCTLDMKSKSLSCQRESYVQEDFSKESLNAVNSRNKSLLKRKDSAPEQRYINDEDYRYATSPSIKSPYSSLDHHEYNQPTKLTRSSEFKSSSNIKENFRDDHSRGERVRTSSFIIPQSRYRSAEKKDELLNQQYTSNTGEPKAPSMYLPQPHEPITRLYSREGSIRENSANGVQMNPYHGDLSPPHRSRFLETIGTDHLHYQSPSLHGDSHSKYTMGASTSPDYVAQKLRRTSSVKPQRHMRVTVNQHVNDGQRVLSMDSSASPRYQRRSAPLSKYSSCSRKLGLEQAHDCSSKSETANKYRDKHLDCSKTDSTWSEATENTSCSEYLNEPNVVYSRLTLESVSQDGSAMLKKIKKMKKKLRNKRRNRDDDGSSSDDTIHCTDCDSDSSYDSDSSETEHSTCDHSSCSDCHDSGDNASKGRTRKFKGRVVIKSDEKCSEDKKGKHINCSCEDLVSSDSHSYESKNKTANRQKYTDSDSDKGRFSSEPEYITHESNKINIKRLHTISRIKESRSVSRPHYQEIDRTVNPNEMIQKQQRIDCFEQVITPEQAISVCNTETDNGYFQDSDENKKKRKTGSSAIVFSKQMEASLRGSKVQADFDQMCVFQEYIFSDELQRPLRTRAPSQNTMFSCKSSIFDKTEMEDFQTSTICRQDKNASAYCNQNQSCSESQKGVVKGTHHYAKRIQKILEVFNANVFRIAKRDPRNTKAQRVFYKFDRNVSVYTDHNQSCLDSQEEHCNKPIRYTTGLQRAVKTFNTNVLSLPNGEASQNNIQTRKKRKADLNDAINNMSLSKDTNPSFKFDDTSQELLDKVKKNSMLAIAFSQSIPKSSVSGTQEIINHEYHSNNNKDSKRHASDLKRKESNNFFNQTKERGTQCELVNPISEWKKPKSNLKKVVCEVIAYDPKTEQSFIYEMPLQTKSMVDDNLENFDSKHASNASKQNTQEDSLKDIKDIIRKSSYSYKSELDNIQMFRVEDVMNKRPCSLTRSYSGLKQTATIVRQQSSEPRSLLSNDGNEDSSLNSVGFAIEKKVYYLGRTQGSEAQSPSCESILSYGTIAREFSKNELREAVNYTASECGHVDLDSALSSKLTKSLGNADRQKDIKDDMPLFYEPSESSLLTYQTSSDSGQATQRNSAQTNRVASIQKDHSSLIRQHGDSAKNSIGSQQKSNQGPRKPKYTATKLVHANHLFKEDALVNWVKRKLRKEINKLLTKLKTPVTPQQKQRHRSFTDIRHIDPSQLQFAVANLSTNSGDFSAKQEQAVKEIRNAVRLLYNNPLQKNVGRRKKYRSKQKLSNGRFAEMTARSLKLDNEVKTKIAKSIEKEAYDKKVMYNEHKYDSIDAGHFLEKWQTRSDSPSHMSMHEIKNEMMIKPCIKTGADDVEKVSPSAVNMDVKNYEKMLGIDSMKSNPNTFGRENNRNPFFMPSSPSAVVSWRNSGLKRNDETIMKSRNPAERAYLLSSSPKEEEIYKHNNGIENKSGWDRSVSNLLSSFQVMPELNFSSSNRSYEYKHGDTKHSSNQNATKSSSNICQQNPFRSSFMKSEPVSTSWTPESMTPKETSDPAEAFVRAYLNMGPMIRSKKQNSNISKHYSFSTKNARKDQLNSGKFISFLGSMGDAKSNFSSKPSPTMLSALDRANEILERKGKQSFMTSKYKDADMFGNWSSFDDGKESKLMKIYADPNTSTFQHKRRSIYNKSSARNWNQSANNGLDDSPDRSSASSSDSDENLLVDSVFPMASGGAHTSITSSQAILDLPSLCKAELKKKVKRFSFRSITNRRSGKKNPDDPLSEPAYQCANFSNADYQFSDHARRNLNGSGNIFHKFPTENDGLYDDNVLDESDEDYHSAEENMTPYAQIDPRNIRCMCSHCTDLCNHRQISLADECSRRHIEGMRNNCNCILKYYQNVKGELHHNSKLSKKFECLSDTCEAKCFSNNRSEQEDRNNYDFPFYTSFSDRSRGEHKIFKMNGSGTNKSKLNNIKEFVNWYVKDDEIYSKHDKAFGDKKCFSESLAVNKNDKRDYEASLQDLHLTVRTDPIAAGDVLDHKDDKVNLPCEDIREREEEVVESNSDESLVDDFNGRSHGFNGIENIGYRMLKDMPEKHENEDKSNAYKQVCKKNSTHQDKNRKVKVPLKRHTSKLKRSRIVRKHQRENSIGKNEIEPRKQQREESPIEELSESMSLEDIEVPQVQKERVRFACDKNGEWAEVGRGSYGCVYLGLLDGEIEVAIKDFYESNSYDHVIHEARMLLFLQNTGIIPMFYGLRRRFDVTTEPGEYCIIMEYFGDGKTLFNVLSDKVELSAVEWIDVVGQLVAGLRLIHRKKVLINDLKADNILIDLNGARKTIRYIDVGMATYKQGLTFQLPQNQMGKYNFLAPEVRVGFHTSKKSDIYSLGYMLEQIFRVSGTALSGLEGLVGHCMREDPKKRPSADDIVTRVHKFIEASPVVKRIAGKKTAKAPNSV